MEIKDKAKFAAMMRQVAATVGLECDGEGRVFYAGQWCPPILSFKVVMIKLKACGADREPDEGGR
jgi:hypothetical protein